MTPPHAEDPTGWFEALYAAAERGEAVVPWDRQAPQQLLVDWAAERGLDGTGRKAVVVGAGYGRDAEFIARFGYRTVAFDVSPTAIQAALRRFPGSPVRYVIADVLDPPAEWRGEFASWSKASPCSPYRPRCTARRSPTSDGWWRRTGH
jgi:SAM-dependent methyltransferase